MPTTLHLEYICTEAERKEAQLIHTNQHLGGGSKWKAQLMLWAMILAGIALLYFRIQTEIPPKDRPWFFAVVGVVLLCIVVWRRHNRHKQDPPTRLEISEQELVLCSGPGRVVLRWPAFSQCLESPTLFVLVDRLQTVLYAIPKRAFPDEAAQDWFRAITRQVHAEATPFMAEPLAPLQAVANGVAQNFQLGYRDYLVRNFTSWRMRSVAVFIFGVIGFVTIQQVLHPDPLAVNGPGKTLLIMLPMIMVMLPAMMVVVTLYMWWAERKYLEPQQVVLVDAGIHFLNRDGRGILPWDTYEYHLENRWCFIIWKRSGSVWYLIPKRAFASAADLTRGRELLQTHLRRSRWFFY